jgi:hypothetical protein
MDPWASIPYHWNTQINAEISQSSCALQRKWNLQYTRCSWPILVCSILSIIYLFLENDFRLPSGLSVKGESNYKEAKYSCRGYALRCAANCHRREAIVDVAFAARNGMLYLKAEELHMF